MFVTDQRLKALTNFYGSTFCESGAVLSALGGDASFRRYFRGASAVAVDSPNATQKNGEFVSIDLALQRIGVRVPKIYAVDFRQGFLLEEDLGNQTFAEVSVASNRQKFYKRALELLPKIALTEVFLPVFDADFIAVEFEIFTKWLLHDALHLSLDDDELNMLERTRSDLTRICLAQPQIAVHRDFHSRNLMYKDGELVLIDFQDMVRGPLQYDAASLIFDCYVNLGEKLQKELIDYSYALYAKHKMLRGLSADDYSFALNAVSLQRHLKVLGIFNRLNLRDGKSSYLKDLPLVLRYALNESKKVGFNELYAFLQEKVQPGVLACAR